MLSSAILILKPYSRIRCCVFWLISLSSFLSLNMRSIKSVSIVEANLSHKESTVDVIACSALAAPGCDI